MARIVVAQSEAPNFDAPISADFQFAEVGAGSVESDAKAFEAKPVHIIKESDVELPSNTPLAPRQYPLLSYPFSHFNRIQSAVHPWAATDVNLVVAAATSTGKTIDGELLMAESIWAGQKALYMPPLRSVANEKYQDWTTGDSSFGAYAKAGQINVSICTGDYNLTPKRKAELDNAHIIVMTPEMLDSRSRRHHHEGNTWLGQIGVLVADELHLIGMNDRGHRLESALMRFTRKNPNCRIVGLSATMPNVEEVAEWLTKLNGKQTIVLNSDWRPTSLNVHYEKVHLQQENYNGRLRAMTAHVGWLVCNQHREDQFLIFVHTKRHGRQIMKDLQQRGVPCQFHYSDLTARERHHIEQMFKTGEYRVIVSTSTLAWGVNLPARRGIICGTRRGYDNRVHPYDIAQMCGRCGRMGLDVAGDAHILIPEDKYETEQRRVDLTALPPIKSQIRNRSIKIEQDATLAFHLVSEYHRKQGGKISSEAARLWFDRTLASHQGGSMTPDEAQTVCDNLYEIGVFDRQLTEHGRPRYSVTGLGKVADYIYLSPFDVADYHQNFKKLFALDEDDWEDAAGIAHCLTQIHSYDVHPPYLPTKEKYTYQKQMYKNDLSRLKGFSAGDVKTVTVYYYLLAKGMLSEIPIEAKGVLANIRMDLDRIFTACELIDRIYAHWGRSKLYWRKIASRILYGVDAVKSELCCVKHVGSAKCELLFKVGVTSLEDMVDPNHKLHIESVLKSRAYEAISHAEQLLKSEKRNGTS